MNERQLYQSLFIIFVLVAAAAVPTGITLVAAPSGHEINLNKAMLSNSPFTDYTTPGIILLSIHGLMSIEGAILAYKKYPIASSFAVLLGSALVIWITLQVFWMGYFSMIQPIFLFIAIMEIFIGIRLKRLIEN